MKFDISRLKGKPGKMRDWMTRHHVPYKLMFFIIGIASTFWFLVRVIPKPSRATYPCMKVAAPFMSGFVTYLLAIAGLTAISRRSKRKIVNVRFGATFLLMTGVVVAMATIPANNTETAFQTTETRTGPEDGPNNPIGTGKGIFPGRVVWVWNPDATNEKFEHNNFDAYDWFVNPENNNEKVICAMFRDGVLKLTGKKDVKKAWDAMFKYFNEKKQNKKAGYTKGEKIFIKINQGQAGWILSREDKEKGYALPHTLPAGQENRKVSMEPTENGPYVVLELLRELVNEVGVAQADISVGDPMNPIYAHNYNVWFKEFPNVRYLDKLSTNYGRTLVRVTENPLVFYSDKTATDKLYDVIENADYMILIPVLKSHGAAGISLTAKLNFGNIGRNGAGHLHYSHIANRREGRPTNTGYHKYRVFVDLMGSKYLGQNTLFWCIESLFGGGASETKGPVKYFMAPFNNDWCNSLFMSLDPVAIESVGYDFLRTEWDGIHKHDPVNNEWESMPNAYGVDDYMHQAADPANWPQGVIYDPDNSSRPIPVLGVHEHWNNPADRQYSRNLGTGNGIELVSIPEDLVKRSKRN
ncbi:MAG: DUF362 domain-containing protein [Bacteroidales bacterium]